MSRGLGHEVGLEFQARVKLPERSRVNKLVWHKFAVCEIYLLIHLVRILCENRGDEFKISFHFFPSNSVICLIRRVNRSAPPKDVLKNFFTISLASSAEMLSAPRQTTLMLSSLRASRATSGSQACAARTPRILLAAMHTPAPDPHKSTPRLLGSSATFLRTVSAISG